MPGVRAFVGLGANLGNRLAQLRAGVRALRGIEGVEVLRTSRLYESAPMYVEDQPRFLNAAVELKTALTPEALFVALKQVEEQSGRDFSAVRNGPRPLDLDLLLYGSEIFDSVLPDGRPLRVPHARMHERAFVLRPLIDLDPGVVPPNSLGLGPESGRNPLTGDAYPVFPAGGERLWRTDDRTHVMGILNVTPDSFSDGGSYDSGVACAVEAALKLVEDGADVVDIGGESTRPGAAEVEVNREIERTVPVIEELRLQSDVVISIDTRKAAVAEAAIAAGADIVNDVSGGAFDAAMLPTVARLEAPYILMHMRGTPDTMNAKAAYEGGVVEEVGSEMRAGVGAAEAAGVCSWDIMLDPGIGFAKKDAAQNLELLRRLRTFVECEELSYDPPQVPCPLLVGASRKRFIGELTGETEAAKRDWGSVGAALAASAGGAFMVRVHNVPGTKQALQVFDAVTRPGRQSPEPEPQP
uniref:Pterin-binding domain-containing protein n=1 Tax=Phaeomonas parva TaxID=124430 RepID=A0A7S1UFZ9_9STRA|mmetsp:Transcript_45483/g.142467  ORF Transcript_45483/g.142467 Transcript_45483/m.142467 type:complete len:469 (+) Transcript_45483:84-1490(+)